MRRHRNNHYQWLIFLVLTGALFLGGCTNNQTPENPAASATTSTETEQVQAISPSNASPTEVSSQFSNLPKLEGEAIVELMVNGSPITIVVNGLDAPITAGNFVDLVNRGVYNGLMFHRVVRQPQPFVAQGGDPQSIDPNVPANQLGTGGFMDPATGEPRYIPLEIKPEGADQPVYSKTLDAAGVDQPPKLSHTRGAVAMARSGLPDSASSQFYFALADLEFLDGDYAVFGYVTEGMEVVDEIQEGDRIESAKVVSGLNNLKTGS